MRIGMVRLDVVFILLGCLIVSSAPATFSESEIREVRYPLCAKLLGGTSSKYEGVPYRIYEPGRSVGARAEFIFLPGFADVPKNHDAFLKRLARAGIRSIAITYPSHSGAQHSVSLGAFTVPRLVRSLIVPVIREESKCDVPIFLGGWSTGALIAEYLAQHRTLENELSQVPIGLVQITPAMPVRLLPGKLGFVTSRTLSSDPDENSWREMAILPRTPLAFPLFALSLLSQSYRLQLDVNAAAPLPRLVFLTGKRDRYVDPRATSDWLVRLYGSEQRTKIWTVHFSEAPHAVQWEKSTRETIETFLVRMIESSGKATELGPALGGPGRYWR